jgi:hypothetical protein
MYGAVRAISSAAATRRRRRKACFIVPGNSGEVSPHLGHSLRTLFLQRRAAHKRVSRLPATTLAADGFARCTGTAAGDMQAVKALVR